MPVSEQYRQAYMQSFESEKAASVTVRVMNKDELDKYQAMMQSRLASYRIVLPPSIDRMQKEKCK